MKRITATFGIVILSLFPAVSATWPPNVSFVQAPFSPLSVPSPSSIAIGDFKGDGILDFAVAAGDFNGDGKQDIVATDILGGLTGLFNSIQGNQIQVGHRPTSVAVGDFNLDGKLDLAITNAADDTVSILVGHGDGTFSSATNLTVRSHPKLAPGRLIAPTRRAATSLGNAGRCAAGRNQALLSACAVYWNAVRRLSRAK